MRTRAAALPLAACALAAFGPGVHAQVVQFRIVERTGQMTFSAADATLDLAVQARILNGTPSQSIAQFAFDVIMPGEADTRGTLTRGLINNTDRTYATTLAANNTVGRGGIAAQYSYLAGISATFNGVINVSSGTFTNTPGSQEIGLISGTAYGASLLATPCLDVYDGDTIHAPPAPGNCIATLADENPDSWNASHPWNSIAEPRPVPTPGDTAPIDAAIGATFFAMGGQWIDIYRFRYTIADLTFRPLTVTLARPSATIGDHFAFTSGSWAVAAAVPQQIDVVPFAINAGASGVCCAGLSCLVTGPDACASLAGQFHAGQACTANSSVNFTTCCYANFDGQNGLGVPDIFAFLNAWLAGESRADADHNTQLQVADIFAFLNAWFAGCS